MASEQLAAGRISRRGLRVSILMPSRMLIWLWMVLSAGSILWARAAKSPHLSCQGSEKAALLSFYNFSGFDGLANLWPDADTQNHTLCACDWFGVQCNEQGFIVSLNLYDPVNIEGAFSLNSTRSTNIPTVPWPLLFAKLKSLKELRMVGFYHDGPLPQEVGLLPQSLTSLSLPQCKIMPPLPIAALTNLSKLTNLDLRAQGEDMEPVGNQPMYFLGLRVPQQLCNISTLESVNLAGNGFGGGIPSCIGLLFHLSHLDLSSNNLEGPIPEQMLFHFSHLDLSYNNLEGPIPEQMWPTISNLTYLDLSNNFLSGQMSSRISNAEKMSSLYLHHNNLTGSIPESVGALSELTYLRLSFNSLTGSIAASLGNLTKLGGLDLSHNMLSGEIPPQLGNLVNLVDVPQWSGWRSLDLSGNWLSGRVPPSLGQIGANASGNLWVDLSSNNLTGDLPWILLTSGTIQDLIVHSNHLTGIVAYDSHSSSAPRLGASVNITSSLYSLDAGANDFTGALLSSITHLSGLRDLYLSNNDLGSGSVPEDSSFTNFTLWLLELDSNNLQGPIPAWLSLLTSLNNLDLSFNQLEGPIPAWFWSLQISYIDLSMNRLRGEVRLDAVCAERGFFFNGSHNYFTTIQTPSNASCSGITLDLHSNQLSGLLPWHAQSNFTSNVLLQSLNLADNGFSGSLPEFTGVVLSGPIDLDLSRNHLSGTIPASISSLGLQSLRLSFNNFSGGVPSSLCSFGQLSVLKLDSNSLSGSIPHQLGQCSDRMTSLVLKDNVLTGSLPRELSNLTQSLVVLDVSHNSLQGAIPTWLQQMQSLRVLILSHNAFSGFLPPSRWNTTQLQVLDLSTNRLRGDIPSESLSRHSLGGFVYNETGQSEQATTSTTLYDESITIQAKGEELVFSYILTTTVSLDLSDNALAGPIPAELGSLDGLIFLDLAHNRLSGRIPESLGKLHQLNSLDLSSNELEGEIPVEALCLLTFLGSVNLSDNGLKGPIPECNQWSTFTPQMFLGNRGLCGRQVERPCAASTNVSAMGNNTPEPWISTDGHEVLVGIMIGVCISFPTVFALSMVWEPLRYPIRKVSTWALDKLGA